MNDQPQAQNTRNPFASGMAATAVLAGLVLVAVDFFVDGDAFSSGWFVVALGGSFLFTRRRKEEAGA